MAKRDVIKAARNRFLFCGGCPNEWSYYREELLATGTWREAVIIAAGWDRDYAWGWLRRWADKRAIRQTLRAAT